MDADSLSRHEVQASFFGMKLSARPGIKNFVWSALAVAALTSQTEAAPKPRPDEPALVAVAPDALPNLIPDGSLNDLALSLERELGACRQLPQEETRDFAGRSVTRREWCTETLSGLLQIVKSSRDFGEVNQLLRTRFDWFQSTGRAGSRQVLFTAYYFPVIQATSAPKNSNADSCPHPLYAKPDELVQVDEAGKKVWRRQFPDGSIGPAWTRKEIDLDGALRNRSLELACVLHPLDAFVFQVQGAGAVLIQQADGSIKRQVLNYASGNGHPYVSLRRILIEEGVPEEFWTFQGIRRWFAQFPEKLLPALAKSPSYVFFREDNDGPLGTTGTLLTPHHSVAIDPKVFPLGSLVFFQTERPLPPPPGGTGNAQTWRPFSRLAVAQDTGGAIQGRDHVDIYWGEGPDADFAGGQMKRDGTLYFGIIKK